MAHLLHLDSSIFPGGASASRSVTQRFRDTVLIGAPMYNYGIPSTLKAWAVV